jgi:glyoxylase-like metal-dependent hydrolase (beta-lactamase superfamily II)
MQYILPDNSGIRITYEVRMCPDQGPRLRARETLKKTHPDPVDYPKFFDFIYHHDAKIIRDIEWVRFHRYVDRELPMTVAVVNIRPSPYTRHTLFDLREIITANTGWYPLVTGSKRDIYLPTLPRKDDRTNRNILESAPLGILRELSKVSSSGDKDGVCFKVSTDTGNIIFDLGFDAFNSVDSNTLAIFISHFHRDHAGGLVPELAMDREIPILISIPTYNYIWGILRHMTPPARTRTLRERLRRRAILVRVRDKIHFHDGGVMEFINVYHCPGALGTVVRDREHNCSLYFGDVCLGNGFSHIAFSKVRDEIEQRSTDSKKLTILLDAAFAQKKFEDVSFSQDPNELLELIRSGRDIPNIWFLSAQTEALMYLFCAFFVKTRKAYAYEKKLIVDPSLMTPLRSIYTPIAQRMLFEVDPFLWDGIGNQTTNFIESHRVYPFNREVFQEIDKKETIIGFLSHRNFLRVSSSLTAEQTGSFRNSRIFLIGQIAAFDELKKMVLDLNPMSFEKVASSEWLFHSKPEDLVELIVWLNRIENCQTVLFHNFTRRLQKFLHVNNVDNDHLKILTDCTSLALN